MTTTTERKAKITTEVLATLEDAESIYLGKAQLIRYSMANWHDTNGERTEFDVANTKGTVGGAVYLHFINYHGYMQDIKRENEKLSRYAQEAVQRIEEFGQDTKLWILTQIIHRINEYQQKADDELQMCYVYAEIVTKQIKA